MKSAEFWNFFETVRPKLGVRAQSFATMFEHLDRFDRPVGILETGCTRDAGNWTGDGNSTVLFDRYAEFHPGSAVFTVDIDPKATAACRTLVSARVRIHTGDSVAFLRQFADAPPRELPSLDLLYLDSYDLDYDNPLPSALHHLKELVAAGPVIGPETMVVVDDSPSAFSGFLGANGTINLVTQPKVGGKGKLVAEYAVHAGAKKVIDGYQAGWLQMRGSANMTPIAAHGYARAVITESPQGRFAVGIDDEFVGRSLVTSGRSSEDEIERVRGFLQAGDRALVVGAHVGTIAIPLARICRHVTAIEANPDTFRLLRCNAILNGVENIELLQFAASDREETLRFVMNTVNSGGSKRMPLVRNPNYFFDNPTIVDVPARSLDAALEGQAFELVFMDIEGSEAFAMRGMPRILSRAKTLFLEYLPHHLSQVAGVTPEEFAALLTPHFARMWVPGTGVRAASTEFAAVLRRMFDQNQGDNGIVFTK